MKQCMVPKCGFIGHGLEFRTIHVPDEPYKPGDVIVACPRCERRSRLADLKESISDFERRKQEAMRTWVKLKPTGVKVCGAGGYVCEGCQSLHLR